MQKNMKKYDLWRPRMMFGSGSAAGAKPLEWEEFVRNWKKVLNTPWPLRGRRIWTLRGCRRPFLIRMRVHNVSSCFYLTKKLPNFIQMLIKYGDILVPKWYPVGSGAPEVSQRLRWVVCGRPRSPKGTSFWSPKWTKNHIFSVFLHVWFFIKFQTFRNRFLSIFDPPDCSEMR